MKKRVITNLSKILFISIFMIFFSNFVSASIDIDFSNETIIMPGDKQILTVSISKPPVSDIENVVIDLEIDGSAYFMDQKRKKTIEIVNPEWNGTLLKSMEFTYPIVVQSESGKTVQTISIDARYSYYKVLFGYKKQEPINDTITKSFSVIWTVQDEEIYNDFKKLKEEYDALKISFAILQQDYAELSNNYSAVVQENNDVNEEVKEYRFNQLLFEVYKYTSIVLLITILVYVIVYFFKKR